MKSTAFARMGSRPSRLRESHVDLHMHSQHSDGADTVKELIDQCCDVGLTAMAITDHDNIDGYEDGKDYAHEKGIEFIPGVEISAQHEGHDIHILGYYFDPTNLQLNETLFKLQSQRKFRAREIVKRLNELGLQISYERVEELSQDGSIGRAHIASLLIKEEYVSSFREAFDRYLSNEKLGELDLEKLAPSEAIQLIVDAGGIPVLAHPVKTNRDDLIPAMVEAGLKGIEVYCHGLSRYIFDRYCSLASRYDLLPTGGGDYHGGIHARFACLGSVKVPYKVVANIKASLN